MFNKPTSAGLFNEHLSQTLGTQQNVTKFTGIIFLNFVTLKAALKLRLMLNKPVLTNALAYFAAAPLVKTTLRYQLPY
jgi:hypothetical protein